MATKPVPALHSFPLNSFPVDRPCDLQIAESPISDDKKEEPLEGLADRWENAVDNPRNWPSKRKWIAVVIVTLYAILPFFQGGMMAPGLLEIAVEYHITNPTIITLTLTISSIPSAFAPLVLAPLSEIYGRKWILHSLNILMVGISLGCAFSPNVGTLIVFRFLVGLFGSASGVIGGGVVSDLFAEHESAKPMALLNCAGALLGAVIGPVSGGFVVQTIGIKWLFLVGAGASVFATLVGIPLLQETYGPTHGRPFQPLWIDLTRAFVLLCRSFICLVMSLYTSLLSGIAALTISTLATLLQEDYGFGPGVGGVGYLGLGFGFFVGAVTGARFSGQLYKVLSAQNCGKGTPEMRMPVLLLGSLCAPIGLFWYGWSAQAKMHWIMPIIGTGITGFATLLVSISVELYLVDAFTHTASAIAAVSALRSILSFVLPLFGQQMFDKLGNGGGNSLLAGLSIFIGIPFPVWIYYRGAAMRARSPYTV